MNASSTPGSAVVDRPTRDIRGMIHPLAGASWDTLAVMNLRDLVATARRLVIEAGFEPDLPPPADAQVRHLSPRPQVDGVRDLRERLWSSIDNEQSRDLDQIEWAERRAPDRILLSIGLADVDDRVPAGSPLDDHAGRNTTSVYTGVATFPMLPPELSEDLTSLHERADRLAVVVDLVVVRDGTIAEVNIERALVRNRARLSYDQVGPWLEGNAARPEKIDGDLEAQLRLQDEAARWLKTRRQQRGALELETIEARPVVVGDGLGRLELTRKSRARELIEDLMLAANTALAGYLESRQLASLRRVVRSPKRWDRIVAVAAEHGETLPAEPSAPALAAFLTRRRAADPTGFPEVSLAVVKLLGAGSYAVERPGQDLGGHFALAVPDYTHSTAPNRRYADLVTQRLVKAVLAGRSTPYTDQDLDVIATQCTRKEDDARKVERRMRKIAAAVLLAPRIGDLFDAIVTGVTPDGTFARLLDPPAEGRIVRGETGLDVGHRLRVRLLATDAARGFIDFAAAPR
jgi:VacB/RNase II family 3'-5' exoribonuclease